MEHASKAPTRYTKITSCCSFPRFQCQGALFNPFVNQRTIGIEKLSCSFGGIKVLLLGSIGETAIYAAVAFRCNHQWFNINRNHFLSWQLGGLSTTPNLCSHKLQHHEGSQHPCAWKSHKRFKHRGIDGCGTCPCSGGLGWNQIDFSDDSEGSFQGDFFLNALVPPIWKGVFLGRTKLDPPSTATPHRSRHATRHAGAPLWSFDVTDLVSSYKTPPKPEANMQKKEAQYDWVTSVIRRNHEWRGQLLKFPDAPCWWRVNREISDIKVLILEVLTCSMVNCVVDDDDASFILPAPYIPLGP